MTSASTKSYNKSASQQIEASARDPVRPITERHVALALQAAAGNRAVAGLLNGSSGKPLDPTTRVEMESKFSTDFADVRVHTGNAAAATALAAGARALTKGRDIFFGDGYFSPGSRTGKRLLAHELAHVIQQSRLGGRNISATAAETEARAAGADVAAGQAATVQASTSAGAQADPLNEDEIRKQIADNEARAANASSPEEADALFQEREVLQQQLSNAAPAPEAPSGPQPPAQVQAPTTSPTEAFKVQPFDPQAGNPFVKWLLYRNDTPVLDALTNDKNLKMAQDAAAGVAITAGTIATGGLLAEAAAGAGAGAVTAGAIGGAGGSTASVALKSAYKGELPTAKEAITEIGVGTLTGGVGGGLGGAAAKAGLGKIVSGAIGGAGGAATQTAANAGITGKVPTAKEALLDIAEGAAVGSAFSAGESALGRFSTPAEGIPGVEPTPEAVEGPVSENSAAETQAPVQEAGESPVAENAAAETQAVSPAEAVAGEQQTGTPAEQIPGVKPTPEAVEGPVPENASQAETWPEEYNVPAAPKDPIKITTDNARLERMLNLAESGEARGFHTDEELFEAYQDAMNRRQPGPLRGPRQEFNNFRGRVDLPEGFEGPIHHEQYPMRQYPGEATNAENLYATATGSNAHKDFHSTFGETGGPYRAMEPGFEQPGMKNLFDFANTASTPPPTSTAAGMESVPIPAPAPAQVDTNPPVPEAPVPDEPPLNYDPSGAQAEIPSPEAAETAQGRLRIENGQIVNYGDPPRLRVDTTPPQRIRFEPEPSEYLEPEPQSSELPLKKRFLRRDFEER